MYLFLQGLERFASIARLFCLTGFMLGSMEAMAYDARIDSLHVWMSPFCLKNFEIAPRISSDRFFPIFSTLEGSLSSTERSTRSSMGPMVPSSSSDLGSMVSSSGPSLAGHWSTTWNFLCLEATFYGLVVALSRLLMISFDFVHPWGMGNFINRWRMSVMAISSLRKGLSRTTLKAEGWSITRKSAITHDCLGYSPKVIRSKITSRGMTESLVKP